MESQEPIPVKYNFKAEHKSAKCGCIYQARNYFRGKKSKYHEYKIPMKLWQLVRFCKTHTPKNG